MTGNISKAKGFKGEDGKTPSIVFAYDPETGNLYYNSNGILIDKDYAASQNFATKDFVKELLGELSTTGKASITLYADRWEQSESENMWYQEVVVANANITPNSKVDLQLSAEQVAVFYEKTLAFVAENEDGVVTVYCVGQVPTNDYVIQATVSEVLVNGE